MGTRVHKYYQMRWMRFVPLVIGLLGLPMVLGMIPPNAIYGLRTTATLSSNAVWYSANFWSGLTSLIVGLSVTVGNILMDRAEAFTPNQKMWSIALSPLLVAFIPAIAGFVAA